METRKSYLHLCAIIPPLPSISHHCQAFFFSPHPLPCVCVCVLNIFIFGCVLFYPFSEKRGWKKLKCTRKIICSNLITLISKARAGGQFPQPAICIFNLEYTITDQPAFNVLVPNKTYIYFSSVCKVKLFFCPLLTFLLFAECLWWQLSSVNCFPFYSFFNNFCHILIIIPEDSVSF